MTNENKLQEKFPFLTGIRYNNTEYVGIVQNTDNQIISFYDVDSCKSDTEKQLILEYGDLWWWESNRMLPIDVFLFQEMQTFRHCVKTFILKETEIIFGVNDQTTFTYTKKSSFTLNEWPFDQQGFLIINIAVGGNLGGPVNTQDISSMKMYVDYVRIYQ